MEAAAEMPTIKQIMCNIAEVLPDDATWDDVEYELEFVRTVWSRLQRRRADEETVTHQDLKQRLGIV